MVGSDAKLVAHYSRGTSGCSRSTTTRCDRTRMCACTRVCVSAPVCVRACVLLHGHRKAFSRHSKCADECVERRQPAVIVPAARGRVCFAFGVIGWFSRASAAGATWRSRTTSAPWASRYAHTSVIDAAGAIYVIGGYGRTGRDGTFFQDVWVSTDGGARPDSVRGGGRGVDQVGTQGYYSEYRGYSGILQGAMQWYSRGIKVL
jgi:hypothetical protein